VNEEAMAHWGAFLPNKKARKIEINKKENKLKSTKIKQYVATFNYISHFII
jgi:hypothetical protein